MSAPGIAARAPPKPVERSHVSAAIAVAIAVVAVLTPVLGLRWAVALGLTAAVTVRVAGPTESAPDSAIAMWTHMRNRFARPAAPTPEQHIKAQAQASPVQDLSAVELPRLASQVSRDRRSRDAPSSVTTDVPPRRRSSTQSPTPPPSSSSSSLLTAQPSLFVRTLRVDGEGAASVPPPSPTAVRQVDAVVTPNSDEPFEFENAFMKGKLLFLLKREGTSHKYSWLFEGRRRLFWVQLQVQFKEVPSGVLYIGGEVPKRMQLGFFTGGLTKIILGILQSLVRGLHASFGALYPADVAVQSDEELPHICFPLYTAVDQFVCTPAGQPVPELGSMDFGEAPEASSARRKSGEASYRYNTTDTYSFHFHSFFIDFDRWKAVNIPGMRDVDLSAFWSDMPLRIVAYSLRPPPAGRSVDMSKVAHTWSNKEYNFCVELSHCTPPAGTNDAAPAEAIAGTENADTAATTPQLTPVQKELSRFEFSVPAWMEYYSTSRAHSERRVAYVFLVREYHELSLTEDADLDGNTDIPKPSRILKDEYVTMHAALDAFAPLAPLEHQLLKRGSKDVFSAKNKTLEEAISVRSRSQKYRKVDNEREFLERQLVELMDQRILLSGLTHQQLSKAQLALLELLSKKKSSLNADWSFLATQARYDSLSSSLDVLADPSTLVPTPPTIKELRSGASAVQVVRGIDATKWRHEWLVLDKAQHVLRFFRMSSSTATMTVDIKDAVFVREDPVSLMSLLAANEQDDDRVEIYWLHLGLVAKCIHFGFSTRQERSAWRAVISNEIESLHGSMDAALLQPLAQTVQQLDMESFSCDAPKASWNNKRFVLNDRCSFVLHVLQLSAKANWTPSELVAQCVSQAMGLQAARFDTSSTQKLVDFLDSVSMLRWADLDAFKNDEEEKKAFFLNLFHLIVLHGSVLDFLPKSKTQWSKFFNGMSYNVGGMLFAPAEIEHCILRAAMSSLRLPIAFLVIPRFVEHDERSEFRLTRPDFRINCALNCMSKSCPRELVVFHKTELDQQLNRAMAFSVELSLTYDRSTRVVLLPKVCEWFRQDFVDEAERVGEQDEKQLQLAMVRLLARYLHPSKRQLFDLVLANHASTVSKWKYAKYNYHFHDALVEAPVDADGDTL